MKMYVARDKNGEVYLHRDNPPLLAEGVFHSANWIILDKEDFPDVTFENSPREVELKLVMNNE